MGVGNALKILIVEDEVKIADMIKTYLEAENYSVDTASNGLEGLEKALSSSYDLVVLDLMLPEKSGIDVCKEVRAQSQVPIIMLTAKTQEVEKLLGLELGADDYITKPFSLAELAARIKAVLRRTGNQGVQQEQGGQERIVAGDLIVEINAHQALLREEILNLTPTEFKILETLIKHPGRVYSRLQLMEASLGEVYSGYERSIDTHVSNLRKKIENDPTDSQYILTVFGIGYKFNPNYRG